MADVLTKARERVVSLFEESVSDNPLVVKDLRTRMRGGKAFMLMGAYVLLMGIAMLIGLSSLWDSGAGRSQGIPINPMLGRDLFFWLNVVQVGLITLAIPSLTAGSLTQELENRTMDMLVLTPISPLRIVLGKQLSAFLYSLVLVVCSLPIAATCLVLGGISPMEMAITYLLLIGWAFMLASSGVMWSSMANRMATATGNTFGFCLICFLITLAVGGDLSRGLRGIDVSIGQYPFGLVNPIWAPLGSYSSAQVCGLSVPLALVSFLVNAAVGVLFLLVASTHVWRRKIDMAMPIRVLLILIGAAFTWLSTGSVAAGGRGPTLGVTEQSVLSLLLLIIFAAVFTAGKIKARPGEPILNYAFSGRKAFRSDVGGAMSFVLLWALIDSVVLGLTLLFSHSTGVVHWAPFFEITFARLSVLAGFCGIGILASCLMKQRKNAIGLPILIAMIGVIGQVVQTVMSSYLDSTGPSILSILWLLSPIVYATGHTLGGDVWWGDIAWLLTSAVYLIIGYLALLAAGPALARSGGVVDDEN